MGRLPDERGFGRLRMDCAKAKEDLAAYALGDLPGSYAAELKAHLDACAGCSAAFARIGRAMALLEADRPAGHSEARVRRAVNAFGAAFPASGWSRTRTAVFAAAASLLLAFAIVAAALIPGRIPADSGSTADPGSGKTSTPGVRIDIRAAGYLRVVSGEPRLLRIERPETGGTYPADKGDEIWIGDEIVSDDPDSGIVVQFYSDSMSLSVDGKARVRVCGSSPAAYSLHLDSGSIKGEFNLPLEFIEARGSAFVIESPVGLAEMFKGKEFRAVQEKVDHYGQNWTCNSQDDSFSMNFSGYDLVSFMGHVQRHFENSVAYNPAELAGVKISLICNHCPRAMFIDLLDNSLAYKGFSISKDGGMLRVSRVPPREGDGGSWNSFAHGGFRFMLPEGGSAKVSGRDPKRPVAVMLQGREEGRVRPAAAAGLNPTSGPAAEILAFPHRTRLTGTFVSSGNACASVQTTSDDGRDEKVMLREGDLFKGYKVASVWWDRVALERDGREFEIRFGR